MDKTINIKFMGDTSDLNNDLDELKKAFKDTETEIVKTDRAFRRMSDGSLKQYTDLIIKTDAYTGQARKAFRQFENHLTATERQLTKTSIASSRLKDENKKLANSFNQVEKSSGLTVKHVVGYTAAYYAASTAIQVFIDALASIPQAGMEYQASEAALLSVLDTMENVTAEMAYLEKLALDTGTSISVLRKSYKMFTAAALENNFSLDENRQMFENIAKAGRTLNLSADEMGSIFTAMTQIMNKGKVTAEELQNQLGERIPAAVALMARSMGISTEELAKRMEKGAVKAKDVLVGFTDTVAETFGGAAFDKAASNLQAELGRLENSWKYFAESIFFLTEDLMSDVVSLTSDALDIITINDLAAYEESWALTYSRISDYSQEAADRQKSSWKDSLDSSMEDFYNWTSYIPLRASVMYYQLENSLNYFTEMFKVRFNQALEFFAGINADIMQHWQTLTENMVKVAFWGVQKIVGAWSGFLSALRQGADSVGLKGLSSYLRSNAEEADAAAQSVMNFGNAAAEMAGSGLGLLSEASKEQQKQLQKEIELGKAQAKVYAGNVVALENNAEQLIARREAQKAINEQIRRENEELGVFGSSLTAANSLIAQNVALDKDSEEAKKGKNKKLTEEEKLQRRIANSLEKANQQLLYQKTLYESGEQVAKEKLLLAKGWNAEQAKAQVLLEAETASYKELIKTKEKEASESEKLQFQLKLAKTAYLEGSEAVERLKQGKVFLSEASLNLAVSTQMEIEQFQKLYKASEALKKEQDNLTVELQALRIEYTEGKPAADAYRDSKKYLSLAGVEELSVLKKEIEAQKEAIKKQEEATEAKKKHKETIKKLEQEYQVYIVSLTQGAEAARQLELRYEGLTPAMAANQQQLESNLESTKQFRDAVYDSIRNAESLKDVFSNLGDYLKNWLFDMIATFAANRITAFFGMNGSIGSSLINGVGGGIAGLSSGSNPLTSLLGLGGSQGAGGLAGIGNLFTGNQIGSGIASVGNTLGINSLAGAGAYSNWMYGGTGLLGGLFGQKAFGGHGGIGGGLGATIGMAVGGPIGALAGGLLGGLVGGLFGGKKETQDTGIELGYSGSSVTGRQYEDWKQDRGWFRSDKTGTNYSGLDSAITDPLTQQLEFLHEQITGIAEKFPTLGKINNLDNYSSAAVKISTKDKSEDEIKAEIQNWLKNVQAGMYQSVFGNIFDEFQKSGEDIADTINRVVSSVTAVEIVLDQFGYELNTTEIELFRVSNALVELAGGLEEFTKLSDYYYENYFTQEEKLLNVVKANQELVDEFNSLNSVQIETKEQLRELADGLDLSTEEGQKLFAEILKIAPALDVLVQAQAALNLEAEQLKALAADLSGYLTDLTLGNLSTASTSDKLQSSKESFDSLVSKALEGDQAAFNDLKSVSNQLLGFGREAYASSSAYTELFSYVTSALQQVIETNGGEVEDSTVTLLQQEQAKIIIQPESFNEVTAAVQELLPLLQNLAQKTDLSNSLTENVLKAAEASVYWQRKLVREGD